MSEPQGALTHFHTGSFSLKGFLLILALALVGGNVRTFILGFMQEFISNPFLAKCAQSLVFALIAAVIAFSKDLLLDYVRSKRNKNKDHG